ncbi:HemK-related putative methylase [Methanocella conradii HZ254]|uniref:HemK-related putative methylase n=1 Tax=Methanocella conradii (strain DSM 24694 / JCM 17849 / CGMCC 1.5162 / HZ254) TaxID=1041930 RepID=H8IAX7_METCZ|nr:HemK2/MTQ2 family protein methyltransferase [Methanocella conradii]AFD00987.1 HemK-related putative methylase [Methanocella conradii HZ254]MDI6897664.1 class I SAM-dependent methyltransferase [Methanocella conradii]
MSIRIYRDKEFELLDEVYDPGEDSFLLVEAALNEARPCDKVLEVGTGCGIVSLFVKEVAASVVATDISPHACRNARLNGVPVVRTDLFSGICGRFDLVVFNPPYLPTPPEERLSSWLNRAFDGGPTGRKEVSRFLADIDRILAPGGRILTVISTLTGIDETKRMFEERGFKAEQVSSEKVPFERLVVLKCIR